MFARGSDKPNPLRLLVVEDSKEILLLMKLDLEDLGFSVLTAADAASALEIALREQPDVLISDLRMPDIDGYELIRRVRSIPELASLPAIVITGLGMRDDSADALAAGYDAFLVKPVDLQELASLIRRLKKHRREGH